MSLQTERLRQKFRQQIRSKQINQYMKLHRSKAINDCLQIEFFLKIQAKIKQSRNQGINMQLVQQLISLLQQQPQHQNTYILIYNYMVAHGDSYKYFAFRLLSIIDIAKKVENYKYTLFVTLYKAKQIQQKILQEYDQTISEVMRNTQNQEQLAMWFSMINFIMCLESPKQTGYLPKKSISQFFKKLSQYQLTHLRRDTESHIIQIVYQLGLEHLQHPIVKTNIPQMLKVLAHGIQYYCKFRPDYITILKRIVLDYFVEFEGVMETQLGMDVMGVMCFVYCELPRERVNILTIFQCIFTQISFEMFVRLLNNSICSVILTNFMIFSPEQLALCLRLIWLIYKRIQDNQQQQMLSKIKDVMEENKLQYYLVKLMESRHEERVEKAIALLVDDYYSQEIAQ